ncbi:hypothetical protein AYI68_g3670 [Smittium mucronatum]|uniref:Uncharacterized protein n=1 Tax=Smittium mucronatum TaxID=133383 RepID=A0A1R0GZ82_9FUNG|nr:hypothetical protein AYI68_g3670 [Smittium mucronatum]
MGMFMRNHDLVVSGSYPYRFFLEFDAWREVEEDRDIDASEFFSTKVPVLGNYLDPSVNLASGPNPPVRFWPIISTVGAIGGVREKYLP